MKDITRLGKKAMRLTFYYNLLFRSFRRKVLFSLNTPLGEELEFIRAFTIEAPKIYQLWQHRQIIVGRMASVEVASMDLEATKDQLADDAKNIHCWQYRQWLLRHFNLPFESELEYTEILLKKDVYNNSAWNHRYFLIKNSKNYQSDNLLREFELILSFLYESTEDNECFWNYLAAIIIDYPLLSIETVISKLAEKIGSPKFTRNYLFLRFLSRFNCENHDIICQRLKDLHPINRTFWNSLVQK